MKSAGQCAARVLSTPVPLENDAHRGDGPWLAGRSFSLADTGLTPYLDRLNRLGLLTMWTRARSRLTDWFARIRTRPNYDRAHTSLGPVDHDDLLIERGEIARPEVEALLAEA